jgi:O-6-methylguanine DNA methyltransferase
MSALQDIELDLAGTPPFFRAAWDACRNIPPGETRSYRWLAAEAGNPLALRAAGQAMARNRFSLIIPCHRVIASDGGLGGYGGGGLGVKAKLLQAELEQATEG